MVVVIIISGTSLDFIENVSFKVKFTTTLCASPFNLSKDLRDIILHLKDKFSVLV